MFYSQFILAKKGPLGTIWIAAHLERKLRKNQVTETNIGVSVDSILFPEVPIALRLSGHLLLGVVRIYSRKVNYLFNDCSEALSKIKQAFHTGAVDLPPEAATAPFHSITLPETFDLDDLELLPDQEALFLANSSTEHHVTSREQITLQEPIDDHLYLGSQFELDERFPDADAPRFDFEEDVFYLKPHDEAEKDPDELAEEALPTTPRAEEQAEQMDIDEQPLVDPINLNESPPGPMEVDAPATTKMLDINEAPEAELEEPEIAAAETGAVVEVEDGSAPVEVPASELPVPEMLPEAEEEQLQPEVTENEPAQVVHETAPVDEAEAAGAGAPTVPAEVEAVSDHAEAKISEAVPEAESGTVETEAEVPEIEKLRSAVETDHNMPELFEAGTPTPPVPSDANILKEMEETPTLKQDASGPSPPADLPEFFEVPGDDDLLASILGRRSSALRVAPTPSDMAPAKRQKTGPKHGPKKRKIQVDPSTVLNGDDMRQQLADTSDVRRVRKRVPCSGNEVRELEKEAFGQQIFEQPSFPGLCDNLREVYHSVNCVDEARALEQGTATPKSKHIDLDPEETFEAVSLAEKPFYELDDLYYRLGQQHEEVLEDAVPSPEPQPNPLEDSVAVEKPAETTVDQEQEPPAAAAAAAAAQDGEAQQPVVEADEETQADVVVVAEPEAKAAETPAQKEPEAAAEEETDLPDNVPAPDLTENVPAPEEATVAEPEVANMVTEEEAVVREEAEIRVELAVEPEVEAAAVAARDDEPQQAAAALEPEPEQIQVEEAVEEEPASTLEESPTEALGFLTDAKDADEEAGLDDEYGEDPADNEVQDNSGWSVRTRAVCQYLRFAFESMETPGKENSDTTPKLGLERLLQGKTRREAARMFFETLVLKTKDFVNVEQASAFDKILISPRAKLMKAEL